MTVSVCNVRVALRVAAAIVAATLWSLASPAYPVQFVDAPPLAKVVTTPVEACAGKGAVQLPIITWGGDIATIHANGDAATTAKGSLLDKAGLDVKLVREDIFASQLKSYLACKSPFLRGTLGMLNLAADVTEKDPRTKMTVIYQLTWSAGGDAMVVKDTIKKPADLKGKTIALQAYGPHTDYLAKLLDDAGLTLKDVKVKWVKDLTGGDNTPGAALHQPDVDAAVVISPDALALTSNGTVGTGAEDSVKGATILLSTRSANRIIADVYAVRTDYFNAHRDDVMRLTKALLASESDVRALMKAKSDDAAKTKMLTASAKILLDSEKAVKDAEGMYGDAEFAAADGNVKFFADAHYPRSFDALQGEIQGALAAIGLMAGPRTIAIAHWDYKALAPGAAASNAPRFDTERVATVVSKKEQQGTLAQAGLFSFEVFFKPNQNTFAPDLYATEFKKVIKLAATYGGAIITIEGHSDPLAYLKKVKEGAAPLVLNQLKQAAKNLSLTRANAVRDSLIKFAGDSGVNLDPSQFAVVGLGISKPKNGLCAGEPCSPQTEQEWLNNMRVEFHLIQVEAEESLFKPL